jgi:hypothetical protein
LTAVAVDGPEILQNLCGIHPAEKELFLDKRQVVTNEVEIKHGNL